MSDACDSMDKNTRLPVSVSPELVSTQSLSQWCCLSRSSLGSSPSPPSSSFPDQTLWQWVTSGQVVKVLGSQLQLQSWRLFDLFDSLVSKGLLRVFSSTTIWVPNFPLHPLNIFWAMIQSLPPKTIITYKLYYQSHPLHYSFSNLNINVPMWSSLFYSLWLSSSPWVYDQLYYLNQSHTT